MSCNPTKLSLKKRAKTFYFASFFFSKEVRNDVNSLYSFCRYIDDIGDEKERSKNKAKIKLKLIKKELTLKKSSKKVISDFLKLVSKYNINKSTPRMLIDGVMSDLNKVNLKNYNELIIYSYKVAGTVGLMMCKIMRVNNRKQRLKAIQLGIAMQMTNIARDIEEDLKRNRVYLPKEFRSHKDANFEKVLTSKKLQTQFSSDLEKLLQLADNIYMVSWEGILKLPLKFKIPIAIASGLYQSIGKKIRMKKYQIWNQRVYLTKIEKVFETVKIIYRLLSARYFKANKEIDRDIKIILKNLNSKYCD
ncbi:MAG: phytoene/squalene synthase family protein [Pseudomonadota bacterium]|nr:phytoene/squalene synthase family protein [Pseudomonadota bacterium]